MIDKKVASIIISQCNEIEERYLGHREAIADLIIDILDYERRHRISRMHIQKQINHRCSTTAKLLMEQRGQLNNEGG